MPVCPYMLNSAVAAGNLVLLWPWRAGRPQVPHPVWPPASPNLQLCTTPAFNIFFVPWHPNKKVFPASRFSVNLKALDADSYRATTSLHAAAKWCQHSLDMDALVLGCIQTLQLMVSSKEQVQTLLSACRPLLLLWVSQWPSCHTPPELECSIPPPPFGTHQTVAGWDSCREGWMHFSHPPWGKGSL